MTNAPAWTSKFYQPLPYNPASEISVLHFAGLLVQQHLRDRLQFFPLAKANGKGQFGNVLEEFYFYKKLDSLSEPDFPCGVELKSVPLRPLKKTGFSVKERVSLSMINYLDLPKESFDSSTFLKKNSRILLVFYLWKKNQIPTDAVVETVYLWQIPPEDLPVFRDDWSLIHQTVSTNRAGFLSEGQTRYLGACTKGAGRGHLRLQGDKSSAKPRAFSLKRTYVQYIYEKHILGLKTAVPALRGKRATSVVFEDAIPGAFEPFLGLTAAQIAKRLGLPQSKAKNFSAIVTKKLFNVPEQMSIEEFIKAGIIIKTIRVKRNGKPKEHISFSAFKMHSLLTETWEDSILKEKLSTRFFFVIYVEDDSGEFRLRKTQFWAMPIEDIEKHAKWVWSETRKRLKSPHKVPMPGQRENQVCHVRPHGRDATDAITTPSGWKLTRSSFWLDHRYVTAQLGLDKLVS